jgi:hypothetical protein
LKSIKSETALQRWIAAQHCRLIDDAIREAVETWDEDDFHYVLRSAKIDYYKHFKARSCLK